MEPSGCLIRDRKAFGWRGLEEASGVLFGVHAKTPRLSTWRLFVFLIFLLEIMMLRRAEPAIFLRAFQQHASLTVAPGARTKKDPAQLHRKKLSPGLSASENAPASMHLSKAILTNLDMPRQQYIAILTLTLDIYGVEERQRRDVVRSRLPGSSSARHCVESWGSFARRYGRETRRLSP